jgi:hypothetical protein
MLSARVWNIWVPLTTVPCGTVRPWPSSMTRRGWSLGSSKSSKKSVAVKPGGNPPVPSGVTRTTARASTTGGRLGAGKPIDSNGDCPLLRGTGPWPLTIRLP